MNVRYILFTGVSFLIMVFVCIFTVFLKFLVQVLTTVCVAMLCLHISPMHSTNVVIVSSPTSPKMASASRVMLATLTVLAVQEVHAIGVSPGIMWTCLLKNVH